MRRETITLTTRSSSISFQFLFASIFFVGDMFTALSTVNISPGLPDEYVNRDVSVKSLLVPNVQPTKHDQYICTFTTVDKDRESYIVQLEAQAEASKAHHILLFGCSSLGYGYQGKKYWECNEGNICNDMKILFAWAKNAPPTSLPKDVGFKIGGSSGINFLVLQVHYAVPLKEKDNSGLRLHITHQPQKYVAGILILIAMKTIIPPNKEKVHSDVNCLFVSRAPIYMFAYRVHAHSLGTVISGYRVGKTDGAWTLLGKGNPQWPQAFYPTQEIFSVQNGDILASRCTFNSTSRTTTTRIGSTANDEMCNFYIMYYSSEPQAYNSCVDEKFPSLTASMPVDSHVPLPPNPLLEEYALHTSHHHVSDESTQQSAEPGKPGDVDSAKLTVFKKGHGGVAQPPDYADYDALSKLQYSAVSKETDPVTGIIRGDQTAHNEDDDSSAYEVHRGQIHHMLNPSELDQMSTKANDDYGSLPPLPEGKFLNWFSSSAAQKERKCVYKDVSNWPLIEQHLGQVTSVAFDANGNVVIFHRGDKVWGFSTFDLKNRYTDVESGPIDADTVLTLDKNDGRLLHSWGKDMFFMPHGLFLDHGSNVWITDVALHQVFKYGSDWSTTALLTLGVRFEPDDDSTHFCKPTSVAVMKNGEFFVADGYCNNRILKYSAKGELILQWGRKTASLLGFKLGVPPSYAFDVPHGLALAEDKGVILVADRENGRIQCFYTGNGTFHSQIQDTEFGGRLFGVAYSPADGGTVFAVNGPSIGIRRVGVKGFVIKFDTRETFGYFTPNNKAMSNPHDIISTLDGQYVYVAEIGPNRVWKYIKANNEDSAPRSLNASNPIKTTTDGDRSDFPGTSLLPAEKNTVSGIGTRDESKVTSDVAFSHKPIAQVAGLSVNTNFTASMIIMSLLAIPVLVMVFVAVFIRLKKQGKFHGFNMSHIKGWLTGYKNPNADRFGIGNLLNRHKGFDRVGMEDSDVDPEPSDSDVEEYSVNSAQKA